jgi:hypothetical protein
MYIRGTVVSSGLQFVTHCMANCLTSYPDPLKYTMITQVVVNAFKAQVTRNVRSIKHDATAADTSFQLTQSAQPATSSSHPVATLVTLSKYLVVYMPPNQLEILNPEISDAEASVRTTLSSASCFIFPMHKGALVLGCPEDKVALPFFPPHFNWGCSIACNCLRF